MLLDSFNFCWVFQKFPFFCVSLYYVLCYFFEMRFEIVRIAAFINSVFSSLNLRYVKYLNVSFNFTLWVCYRVDYWILKFCYLECRLHAGLLL